MAEPARPNPAQRRILERGLLDSGLSAVIQLPTGAGKTWLAERAIEQVLGRGGRAIYLAPLRALAAELWQRWQRQFPEVGLFTGDVGRGRSVSPTPWAAARLMIATPERLDGCTRAWRRHWSWLPEVELVVVDELHLLAERQRGPRLEGVISRLRRLNPFLQVLGLSATIGNPGELADWLDGVAHRDDWRAVPLDWRIRRFRRAADKPALLIDEVRRCRSDSGRSLIFVQSRRRAELLARQLVDAGVVAAHHHAGLEAATRGDRERRFRQGELEALISTGTLEMGLNLPARQVVIYDLQRFDGVDFVPLSVNTIWQRAGRAGRPGLDDRGEVVLLAPSWDRGARRYLAGVFEPLRSGLDDRGALAEQVVAEVGSGLCRSRTQLTRALGCSLASRQGRLPAVEPAVDEMIEAGMLAQDGARLRATAAGRVALRLMLAPATLRSLRGLLEQPGVDEVTFLDLLLVAAATPDGAPRLPVDFEDLEELTGRLARERSALLARPGAEWVESLGLSGRAGLAAICTALVARDWTRLGKLEAVAARHRCSSFEARQLVERLERVLAGLLALASLRPAGVEEDDAPGVIERARALAVMLGYGLDEESVTLTFLPGLGGVLARRLCDAGISDLEAFALSGPEEVAAVRGISRQRATRWVEAAGELVGRRGATALRELGPPLSPRPAGWPAEVDPYRLRRARELTVRELPGVFWEVCGGLEPHRLRRGSDGELRCDCFDAAAGHTCKHQLALRLFEGDEALAALAGRLERAEDHRLDLFSLWMETEEARR